jgi:hypothetical protein
MTGASGRRLTQTGARLCIVTAILTAGCVTREQTSDAINEINREFRAEYERILAVRGTRTFNAGRGEAFAAMRVTMLRLGMTVSHEAPALGYLNVYAPAPRPLDLPEWREAETADLPRAREIVTKHLGPILGGLFTFEPRGLDIVMNVTVIETRAGAEVSLTMRMRETAPPKSGLPRREYAPPTAVRMGLDKIWTTFDQELRAPRRKP